MWQPTYLTIPGTSETVYYNSDSSLWCWYETSMSKWVISSTLGRDITVDGSTYPLSTKTFNNNKYYGTTSYVWYNTELSKWVLTSYLGAGYVEWWNNNNYPTSEYEGDAWWSVSSGTSVEGTYNARGTNRGTVFGSYSGTAKVVAYKTISGWESATLFGRYTPISGGGETGNKYVGWRQVTGNNDLGNLTLNNDGYYAGTNSLYLWYDSESEKWIISSSVNIKDSSVGYWEGDAPPTIDITSVDYTLVFDGEEDDEPSVETYTLTFNGYVEGSTRTKILIGQLAVWL